MEAACQGRCDHARDSRSTPPASSRSRPSSPWPPTTPGSTWPWTRRSLLPGQDLDFYYNDTRPARLMSLGTVSLDKGKHRLTITVQDKNPKSQGYGVGMDEIQIVPVKK